MEEDRNRELLLTVKETARLSGVSVRTLHYYDEIGLLRPAEVTQAGYRLYGERELLRLQQILLFRELEFPLKEIMPLLEGGDRPEQCAGKTEVPVGTEAGAAFRVDQAGGKLDERRTEHEF